LIKIAFQCSFLNRKEGAVILKSVNLEVKKEGIVDTKTGEMKLIDANELQVKLLAYQINWKWSLWASTTCYP